MMSKKIFSAAFNQLCIFLGIFLLVRSPKLSAFTVSPNTSLLEKKYYRKRICQLWFGLKSQPDSACLSNGEIMTWREKKSTNQKVGWFQIDQYHSRICILTNEILFTLSVWGFAAAHLIVISTILSFSVLCRFLLVLRKMNINI